jgi:hypothetical protein
MKYSSLDGSSLENVVATVLWAVQSLLGSFTDWPKASGDKNNAALALKFSSAY